MSLPSPISELLARDRRRQVEGAVRSARAGGDRPRSRRSVLSKLARLVGPLTRRGARTAHGLEEPPPADPPRATAR